MPRSAYSSMRCATVAASPTRAVPAPLRTRPIAAWPAVNSAMPTGSGLSGQLTAVNDSVNRTIVPETDEQLYHVAEYWTYPTRGAGDCEDYAIAKFVALRHAGIAADDLRIIVMRDTIRGEDHAVAAAKLDGHWLMLDNRRMAMVEDANVRNYRPTFVIDQAGVKRYQETPMPVLENRDLVSEAASHSGFETSPR